MIGETIPFWSPFSWWNPNGALISMLDATAQPQWTLRCQPFHLPGVPPSSRTFGCKMSVVLTMKVSENVIPKSSKMSPWQYWNPWWLGDLGPRLGDPQWLKNPLDPNWVIIPPKLVIWRWKMISHEMFVVLRTSIVLPRTNNSWNMCSWFANVFSLEKTLCVFEPGIWASYRHWRWLACNFFRGFRTVPPRHFIVVETYCNTHS